MPFNLPLSRANTIIANIIKTPFKNMQQKCEWAGRRRLHHFGRDGMTHSVEIVNFAQRVHRKSNKSDTPVWQR